MPAVSMNGELTTYDKIPDDNIMSREDCLSLPKLSNIIRESNVDAIFSAKSIEKN